jgi:hypothetical protein
MPELDRVHNPDRICLVLETTRISLTLMDLPMISCFCCLFIVLAASLLVEVIHGAPQLPLNHAVHRDPCNVIGYRIRKHE